MAKNTAKKNTEENVKNNVAEAAEYDTALDTSKEEYAPINLEQQVTVKSIAPWTVGFTRITGVGDVSIPKFGSTRLSRLEIISQVQNNNTLLKGLPNQDRGDHATLLIQDEATIRELGFQNAVVFSDKLVRDLFAISDFEKFEEELKDKIQTRAEAFSIMVSIVRQKLNDYSKIRAVEQHTGISIEQIIKDEKNIR